MLLDFYENWLFLLLLPLVAFLYASVGHGGASGYLALMALFAFTPEEMKPTALLLNLFVAAISFYHYNKEGYFNKTVKIDNLSKNDILQEILLTPVEIGKSIIIDDLHFKTGLTELDDASYRLLDQLVDFMSQNSTLKIEIAGHTDSDGSEEFNQTLSEGRAQSAVNYIIEKGVDQDRLVAKGYGETQPLFENDTEENKANNRRVELKVIGK